MTALSVNLNKIALIRNSRVTTVPNLLEFADICVAAGADGITVHPRPDQRHIRAQDCEYLSQHLSVEFNIEGNPFAGPQAAAHSHYTDYPGFMALVEKCRPQQVTLVPDGEAQLTSDHGFDLHVDGERLRPIIEQCHDLGARVSLFMDPIPEQISIAANIGADRIELYTGPFAEHFGSERGAELLASYHAAATVAQAHNLGVNAGHDLNLDNLASFLSIDGILEVSIGHALTTDAIKMGMFEAVKAYKAICQTSKLG